MIISQTPLRVSLLGGGTDFKDYYDRKGGCVLTMAINKYIYCIVKERFDDEIWINYSKKEIVKNVEDIKHDLVREALVLLGITKGIEITFLADIPTQGTGLGSSSAVLVGLLNALHHFKGGSVTPEQLIDEACEIEINILKSPIGIQDQCIAALGGLRFIEFPYKSKLIELSDVEKQEFEDKCILFFTGIQRSTKEILGNVTWTDEIRDRLRYLAQIGERRLSRGELRDFATVLDSAWLVKRNLEGVTNVAIDEMYTKAKEAGAWGGKLLGAGGGGFLLLMTDDKTSLRKALPHQELPFHISKTGSKIILNI